MPLNIPKQQRKRSVSGDSMKAELLGNTVKGKQSGKPGPPRKSLKTASLLINGQGRQNPLVTMGFNSPSLVTLSDMVIEEHCEIQNDQMEVITDHITLKSGPDVEVIGCGHCASDKIALACELDHMYANCRDDPVSQLKTLRELLLLNLDFVQQLQEDLTIRDRQIATLKQERTSLRQKLERTEKRVSLLKLRVKPKSKSKVKPKVVEAPPPTLSPSSISPLPPLVTCETGTNTDPQEPIPTIPELEFGGAPVESGDTVDAPAFTKIIDKSSKMAAKAIRRRAITGIRRKLPHMRRRISPTDKRLKVNRSCRLLPATLGSPEPAQLDPAQNSDLVLDTPLRAEGTAKEELLYMVSDTPYFTPVGSNYCRSPDSPHRDETVIVPSWRVNQVASCYQLEGTENLDDELFAKRHFKLETDEKRRKRWDLQRVREQKMYEKLKKGRGESSCSTYPHSLYLPPLQGGMRRRSSSFLAGNGQQLTPCKPAQSPALQSGKSALDLTPSAAERVPSFYPEPCDIQFIDICESLPVVAFGQLVQHLDTREFSIPWLKDVVKTRERNEVLPETGHNMSQSTPNNGRSKKNS